MRADRCVTAGRYTYGSAWNSGNDSLLGCGVSRACKMSSSSLGAHRPEREDDQSPTGWVRRHHRSAPTVVGDADRRKRLCRSPAHDRHWARILIGGNLSRQMLTTQSAATHVVLCQT